MITRNSWSIQRRGDTLDEQIQIKEANKLPDLIGQLVLRLNSKRNPDRTCAVCGTPLESGDLCNTCTIYLSEVGDVYC
jgi:hypothetical protein